MTTQRLWWIALAVWCLIGLLRFKWAMVRQSKWKENQEAQRVVKEMSPRVMLFVVLFEMFLWPVELLLALSFWLRKRQGTRK